MTKTILHVESDPTTRALLYKEFKDSKFSLLQVSSGMEAILKLQEGEYFDALLMEDLLPGNDQAGVIQTFLEACPRKPLILHNKKNDPVLLKAYEQLGISCNLKNPSPVGAVLSLAQKLLSEEGASHKTNSEKKGKILIVDDDQTLLYILNEFLSDTGYEIDLCDHPAEALKKLEITKYSLVLMDLCMPDMDGVELTTKLKKKYPDIFIAGMTGTHDEESINRLLQAGAYTVLQKPFKMHHLDRVLQKLTMIAKEEKSTASATTHSPRVPGPKSHSFMETLRYAVFAVLIMGVFLVIAEIFFKQPAPQNQPPPEQQPGYPSGSSESGMPNTNLLKQELMKELLKRSGR